MYKEIHDNKDFIIEMYKAGMSSNEIAAKFSCKSSHPILRILRENNLIRTAKERNKISGAKRTGITKDSKRKDKISDNKIIELYNDGFSFNEIGKTVGISSTTVYRVLKSNDIKTRSISEAINLQIEKGTYKTPWQPMENHIGWKGGRIVDDGYVRIKMPNHPKANKKGYIFEHTYIAEQMIDRPLEPNEVVHHINGIKNDNRQENLMVMDRKKHSVISAYQGMAKGKTTDVLKAQIRQLEQQISDLQKTIEELKGEKLTNSHCREEVI